jgi:hypothetical protein
MAAATRFARDRTGRARGDVPAPRLHGVECAGCRREAGRARPLLLAVARIAP